MKMDAALFDHLRALDLGPDELPATLAQWRELLARVAQTHAEAKLEMEGLEERLVAEQRKLGGFIAGLGDALVILDGAGRIEFANAQAAQILGRGAAELSGAEFADAVTGGWPREREKRASLCRLRECIDSWKPLRDDDGRFMNAARQWVPVSFTLSPLDGEGSRPSGGVVIFRDMSEHKKFERALRQSESRLRAVFESAAVGIVRLDPSGLILGANRAMARMLGLEMAELVGRSLGSLLHGACTDGGPRSQGAAVGGGTALEERRYRHADGRAVWVQCTETWVEDDAGGVAFGTLIVENISDRKQLEVSLRHAQKLESVGRLASGIAHEINTPVQFVCDNVHFLKGAFETLSALIAAHAAVLAGCPEEARRAVARATEEADFAYLEGEVPKAVLQTLDGLSRVASIVQAMKSFAHPEQGEQTVADLNAGLTSTLTVAGNEIHSVATISEEFQEIPQVRCYPGDLNQVFLNLLVNAAHAIGDRVRDSGALGRISVATRRDGDDVVVSIRDTGGGIPEHVSAHMFDPFFTTKEVGKGTGQGLALARAIVVEKHGGQLTYETTLGEGTTFHVRIPIAGAAPSERAAA